MMNRSIPLFLAFAASTLLFSQSAEPVPSLAGMEPVLGKIAAWETNQSREPLYEFNQYLQSAIAARTEVAQIEARLIRMLGPGTTLAGRDFVCRQLSLIGIDASVPALTRMLADPTTAAMARYALDRIPGEAASDALRGALAKGSGKMRVGIVNSLGKRRDPKAVAVLIPLLSSSDAAISGAAFAALGRIANTPALAAIAASRPRLAGTRREAATMAYLRCAEAIAEDGDKVAAGKAFRQLTALEEPVMVRIAALGGLAGTEGTVAIPMLSRELGSPNPVVQATAIRLLNRMPGADVTAIFVRQFPNLPDMAQVQVLAALAGREGSATTRPVAMEALRSKTPEVRTAALAALGVIGDATAVTVLAQVASETEGAEQSAARDSLASLRGADVDSGLVAALLTSSGKVRLELIRAAGERASSNAADALLRIARGTDRDASRESIRALRSMAGPALAEPLLDLVIKTQNTTDRREAALTLASVIRRSKSHGIGPVLVAYRSATSATVRASLLEVMGQVSAADALPVLRGSLQDSDQAIARAAILALSEWLTPDPIPDLLAAAKSDANPTRQILALRGLTRLIAIPSSRSREETVKLLAEAMQLAKQPTEKKAVLAQLQNHPTKEGLLIVEAAANDTAVRSEAKAAADQIREFLRAGKQ